MLAGDGAQIDDRPRVAAEVPAHAGIKVDVAHGPPLMKFGNAITAAVREAADHGDHAELDARDRTYIHQHGKTGGKETQTR